jgi:hypothetical protein
MEEEEEKLLPVPCTIEVFGNEFKVQLCSNQPFFSIKTTPLSLL